MEFTLEELKKIYDIKELMKEILNNERLTREEKNILKMLLMHDYLLLHKKY